MIVKILKRSIRAIRRDSNSTYFIAGIFLGLIISLIFYNIQQTQRIASNLLAKLNRPKEEKENKSIYRKGRTLNGQTKIAEDLKEKIRVLCVVVTSPFDHEERAIHVKRTWGKRCNKLIFASSEDDEDLGAIGLKNVKEGHENLWGKTKEALKHIYENHLHEAEWFLKADVDSYIVLENLRFMLKDFNPEVAYYFGCKFRPHVKQGYMSGGAGYVLSKGTLRKLVEIGFPDPTMCKTNSKGDEDVELGHCLENLGVNGGDTRDQFGRYKFNALPPEMLLFHNPSGWQNNEWYTKFIYYPQMLEADCCSDGLISFHYITPSMMYTMDYLIYRVIPYGLNIENHNYE